MKILRKISKWAMSAFLPFVYRFKFPYAPELRMLDVELTQLCNLKCPMCYREEADIVKASMSVDEFKQILDKFPKLRYINLVGIGETLMHPNLSEIIDIVRGREINGVITTNGTLLTEKNIKKMKGIGIVYVSIDSINPDRYRAIREAELNDVVEGVRRLRKAMPDILLFIQPVMMKDNAVDLPDFPRFAKEVDANGVSLLHTLPLNSEQDKLHMVYAQDADIYLKKAMESAKELGIEFYSRPLKPKEKYCSYPWTMPHITLKGDIYACPFTCRGEGVSKEFYRGESIDVPTYQYKIGNIFKGDFRKIWNGKDMQLLRKKLAGCWTNKELPLEEFLEKRRNVDLQEKFSYCEVCLFRWSSAC